MDRKEAYAAVHEFFGKKNKVIPNNNHDLFEGELIDSMELLELIFYLETELGLCLEQELMSVDNFRNIDKIVATFLDSR
jgi:acyl carrier protein